MSLSENPPNLLAQSTEKLAELYRLYDQLRSVLQSIKNNTVNLNNFVHPVSANLVASGTSAVSADATGINLAPVMGYGSLRCVYSPPTASTNASISLNAAASSGNVNAGSLVALNINTKGTGIVSIPSGTQLQIANGCTASAGVQWNSSTDTLTTSSSPNALNYQATTNAYFDSTSGGQNWSYSDNQITFPTLTSQGSITASSSTGVSLDSAQTISASGGGSNNNLVISATANGTLQLCSNNGINSPFALWTNSGVTFPKNVNVTGTMTYSNFNLHGSLFSSSNTRPAYSGYCSYLAGGYGTVTFDAPNLNSPDLSFVVCTPAIASSNTSSGGTVYGNAYYTTAVTLPTVFFNFNVTPGRYQYGFIVRSSTYSDGLNNFSSPSTHPFYWFAY